MSSVIAEYEAELSSLNLSESQKESVMRMLSTFEKGGAKSIGVKGRPSKSKKVVETGGESDVFEQLLSMGLEDPPFGKVNPKSNDERCGEGLRPTVAPQALEPRFSAKEMNKLDKETEKIISAGDKLEKETEILASKADKLAAKASKAAIKLAKEAEKQAAIKAKEDAKQAVIDAKAAKEAEKAAAIKAKEDAKLAKEAEKEAKAAANPPLKKVEPKKKAVKNTVESAPSTEETTPATNAEQEGSKGNPGSPAEETTPATNAEQEGSKGNLGSPAVRVKKFSFEGVKYLKDTAGTIYDLATQDRIGVWNEEGKKIVFDAKGEAEEEDECSEEEYHL